MDSRIHRGRPAGQQWHQVAAFVIEVQARGERCDEALITYVHHEESDETASWPGVPIESVTEWIGDRVAGLLRST
jgi:hypothetical protein